ncbi:hypothetical protein PIB30_075714 [Stylosanthes scabra]|uniref:Uncharacterized protein n=1 Tax=Stylosanthes scabra TaxID=79078 RepID=A0ABU6RQC7_9FABA|nr:hypothetical protein [Stylosanthes scabra]
MRGSPRLCAEVTQPVQSLMKPTYMRGILRICVGKGYFGQNRLFIENGSRDSTNSMASASSTVSVFDAHRFRKAHNEQLFDSYDRRRKVIPEVGFNLEEDEYPKIMEQIALRGWRRLAAPRTDITSFWCKNSTQMQPYPMKKLLPKKSSLTRAL